MEQAAVKTEIGWNNMESAGEDPVAEMLRARADAARSPSQTWLMPVVDSIDR